MENIEDLAQVSVQDLIMYIGDDITREGLKKTPTRVVKSYQELFKGYTENLDDKITVLDGDGYDQMVILKDIEFFSTCEHHLIPFLFC